MMSVEEACRIYWMNETSGVLRPAIEAYLNDEPMTEPQIAAMRVYLRQWMDARWAGDINWLLDVIDQLTTQAAITAWLEHAFELGIDPL